MLGGGGAENGGDHFQSEGETWSKTGKSVMIVCVCGVGGGDRFRSEGTSSVYDRPVITSRSYRASFHLGRRRCSLGRSRRPALEVGDTSA